MDAVSALWDHSLSGRLTWDPAGPAGLWVWAWWGVLVVMVIDLARRPVRGGLLLLPVRGLLLAVWWVLACHPVAEIVEPKAGALFWLDEHPAAEAPPARDWKAPLEAAGQAQGARLERVEIGAPDAVSDLHPPLAQFLSAEERAGSRFGLVVTSDGGLVPPDAAIAPHAAQFARFVPRPAAVPLRDLAARLQVQYGEAGAPRGLALHADPQGGAPCVVDFFLDGALVGQQGTVEGKAEQVLPDLEPGIHELSATVRAEGFRERTLLQVVAIPDALRVHLMTGDPQGVVARALKVQGHAASLGGFDRLGIEGPEPPDVLLLDRPPKAWLDRPEVQAALVRHAARGGGVCWLPEEVVGALYREEVGPWYGRLPVQGVKPPPPAPPEDLEPPLPEDPAAEAPLDPLPEDAPLEEREAPTLGMLLLIDASESMDGLKLRIAKQAALATASVLHPEDWIGVIAFNGEASTVLEFAKASDRARIIDRISRIRAGGGTDFGPPLQLALDAFHGRALKIKHAILLSDGASRPRPLKPIVDALRADGATLSTVGCGAGFDIRALSDLAAWGGGKFLPAYNPGEVPQVLTIEAYRLIESTGARKRSDETAEPPEEAVDEPVAEAQPDAPRDEPLVPVPFRMALPAPWLEGLALSEAAGVLGVHEARLAASGWPALQLEDGRLLAAHGTVGPGRAVVFCAPLDGAWAAPLYPWKDLPPLIGQIVRFLAPSPASARYLVRAEQAGGRVVSVRIVDREQRGLDEALKPVAIDREGKRWSVLMRREGDRFLLLADPAFHGGDLLLTVSRDGVVQETHPVVWTVPTLQSLWPERGRLAEFTLWVDALDGEITQNPVESLPDLRTVERSLVPQNRPLWWLLGALVLAELGLGRWIPRQRDTMTA